MPFNDLQGVLNDQFQFQVVSDLSTSTHLCLRILSYNRTMFWYSSEICLARVELVTISYSKDIFETTYFASGDATADLMTQL